jgi:superfamily II DNA or RNA helicase
VLAATTAFGKTVVACKMIADVDTTTLVLSIASNSWING